jgi:FkbM family methyltransferase
MFLLDRMRSVTNGALWLVRGAGLRGQLREMQRELAGLRGQLQDLSSLRAQLHEVSGTANALTSYFGVAEARVCHGHVLFLDSRDSLGLAWLKGNSEPFETELLKAHVGRGDVVLDLGANIGYYTLLFASLVGPEGKVFAFEPDPTNFDLLTRNVRRNGYTNVVPVPAAVGDRTGKLRLFLCEENRGDHRTYDSGDGRPSVEVDVVRLDDYLKDFERPIAFVKMDVQGSEPAVLSGMAGLLQRNPRMKLATEFWPFGLHRSGSSAEAFLQALEGQGFALHVIDEAAQRVAPADWEELLRTYVVEKQNYTNLLCLPGR